jgi:hypothetical protein
MGMGNGYQPPSDLTVERLRARAQEYRTLAATIFATDIRDELLWMALRFEAAAIERQACTTVTV